MTVKTATYVNASGSPFTLTSAWQKVVTTLGNQNALILSDATRAAYDIFWTVVPAGSTAPVSGVLGVAVGASTNFADVPIPVGDIYARSATGCSLVVMTA